MHAKYLGDSRSWRCDLRDDVVFIDRFCYLIREIANRLMEIVNGVVLYGDSQLYLGMDKLSQI